MVIPPLLAAHAAFAPYADALGVYGDIVAGRAPKPADVPRFVSPPARSVSAIDYERRVVEQNELIVRPDNLHDVMNALIWLKFPRSKRAISEAHVALGVTIDGKTRPRRRDVLTLFDEAGAMILSRRDDLRELHEAHRWQELFVARRQEFVDDTRVILFGHGAMQQLASTAHRGLTVKALWLPLSPDTPDAALDRYLAAEIADQRLLHHGEPRLPLPLLGVPGWFAENSSPDCYADTDVFRPKRQPNHAASR